jgi:hypothetical protein
MAQPRKSPSDYAIREAIRVLEGVLEQRERRRKFDRSYKARPEIKARRRGEAREPQREKLI